MHKQVLCYKMTIYNAFLKVDRIAMILSNVWKYYETRKWILSEARDAEDAKHLRQ